jgi:(1->4)-alpha-D-glucan 1-alpha-D-glucosylmutase
VNAPASAQQARGRGPRSGRAAGPAPAAIPRATYRVQLHRGFTFADAAALIPYLARLGISHLYCSPYLRARPGSTHGYDIVDHRSLNPEIGSREDFDRLVDTLAQHGMSHLCDVVPNHMAVMGADNAWWMDVLENGPASAYADFFDIDWSPQDPDLAGRVLVPVLGNAYGAALDAGEVKLVFEAPAGAFAATYFDHRFPLDPREYPAVLDTAAARASPRLDKSVATELSLLTAALRFLPERTDRGRAGERRRDATSTKRTLATLVESEPALRAAIEQALTFYNGDGRESRDALNALLEAQAFRLAYWRVASDEINYRRFFDVNELAALRMEEEAVFDATHAFVLDLAAQGRIGGLRIDHPDGLHDPPQYLERLQERYRARVAQRTGRPADEVPGIYVVLEKILAPHERMPVEWAADGDTGYPFANAVNAVLIDPTARARVERAWRTFVGDEAYDFEIVAYDAKRTIMRGVLTAGLASLAHDALRIARSDRRTRDFTLSNLRHAIEEIVAWFPVYRTYVDTRGASAQDRRYIDWGVSRARRMSRSADASAFDFVRALLLAEPPEGSAELVQRYRGFAMRFQQYTAPVAAKGVEDTAFYKYARLVSLNDVGGDPALFGMTRRAFHRVTRDRLRGGRHSLLATSTHDNKRSEDVRARIDVISEMPAAWRTAVRRWRTINRSRKREVDGVAAPSRTDEYLLYQTLAGSFPAEPPDGAALAEYRERMERYMIKAAREAKARTSWLYVNDDYERAISEFVAALLDERSDNHFIESFLALHPRFVWFGMLNSLSMALLKCTAPGVPDIYQGNEILDLSLVDPDNRRAVDYAKRERMLGKLQQLEQRIEQDPACARDLLAPPYDGRAKLWIISRALALRAANPALFADGDYVPLTAKGRRERNVLAFARRHRESAVVVVAGRLFASLGLEPGAPPLGEPAWGDTVLDLTGFPGGIRITNVLTGERWTHDGATTLARVFAHFPGAMLHAA